MISPRKAVDMNLSHFPPEILGQVLSYDSSSYLSLLLWKCGDAQLHDRLSRGVSTVKLKSRRILSFRYPRMLSNFRRLRHLSLICGESFMNDPSQWPLWLRELSDTLETFELDELVVLLNHSPKSTRSSPIIIKTDYNGVMSRFSPLVTFFPRLTTLKMGFENDKFSLDLAALSASTSLTCLSLRWIHVDYKPNRAAGFVSMLPKSLLRLETSLTFSCSSNHPDFLSDWSQAPPHLQHVTLIRCDSYPNDDFSWLPRSLETFEIDGTPPWSPAFLHSLPPRLKSFGNIKKHRNATFEAINTHWVRELPQFLTVLHTHDKLSGALIPLLPKTLTTLESHQPGTIYWSELRAHLVKIGDEGLILGSTSSAGLHSPFQERVDSVWPPGLTLLRLMGKGMNVDDLELLPRTLQTLHVVLGYDKAATPNTLVMANGDTSMGSIEVVKVKSLPPALTRLSLCLAPMQPSISFELEKGVFPSTLRKLLLADASHPSGCLNPKCFEDPRIFPPSLRSLYIGLSASSAVISGMATPATYLSSTGLTRLKLDFWIFGDWHFKLLPRTLIKLNLKVTSFNLGLTKLNPNPTELDPTARDAPPSIEMDIAEGLPPSLTYMEMTSAGRETTTAIFSPLSFASLPHLKKLAVQSCGKFPSPIIRSLSRELEVLAIPLTNLSEKDAPFLSSYPRLYSLSLGVSCGNNLKIAKHWPLAVFRLPLPHNPKFAEIVEQRIRKINPRYFD